ncbi:26710_t:CDS:1, partial [Dentiscutata erythropus]
KNSTSWLCARNHRKTAKNLLPTTIAEQIIQADEEIMASGLERTCEETALNDHGNKVIYLSHKLPLRDEKTGEVVGLLGTSLDITLQKRKQIEEKEGIYDYLMDIIAKAPGHFYWKNREGVFLGCNDAQAVSAGFRSGKNLIGKTDFDLPWKKQATQIRAIDIQVMESGKEYITEELSTLADGAQAVFLSRKTPLYNRKTQSIDGIIGISLDITQLKETQQQLVEAKERAEAANKAKTEFLENIRHDIRTPLAGINGIAFMMQAQTQDPALKAYADILQNSCSTFLALVDDILESV